MNTTHINLRRLPPRFIADDKRVITRYLDFGDPVRIRSILGRLLPLEEAQVHHLLHDVLSDFSPRHRDIKAELMESFSEVKKYLDGQPLSHEQQLLIGAYFTSEYAIESAALFNPSIVPDPDQSHVPPDALRFLMSLRAVGEGHISSIVFRRGIINAQGDVTLDPPPRYAFSATPVPNKLYHKDLAFRRLKEMGEFDRVLKPLAQALPEYFTIGQLDDTIEQLSHATADSQAFLHSAGRLRWLAQANYDLHFPPDCQPAEIVIFPATENEHHGMEDLRLVRFIDDDGTCRYSGTYTAYDGIRIFPMMLETEDFIHFHVTTLNGAFIKNKGIALFPRQIDGDYAAISRHDGEKLYLMRSGNRHFWNEATLLEKPSEPWELVQIGNCGSPLETEAGWILLTHGVGPMRRYSIGAMLLDLHDPSRVLGRLREPLLSPTASEREGYVPNVVYSCGAIIHDDQLIIPYAMADLATAFAIVPVAELIDHLLACGP
jgi:predicted GH43/DUF377 family glycosyl hydrolase